MVSQRNAEHYTWGGTCDGWHLVKRGEVSVIHERMPPGTSEARHFHERAWQFFFVLSGVATLEVGGEHNELRAHEGREVPLGVAHQMMNRSERDVEFLVISQPPSHGDRVMAEGLPE